MLNRLFKERLLQPNIISPQGSTLFAHTNPATKSGCWDDSFNVGEISLQRNKKTEHTGLVVENGVAGGQVRVRCKVSRHVLVLHGIALHRCPVKHDGGVRPSSPVTIVHVMTDLSTAKLNLAV